MKHFFQPRPKTILAVLTLLIMIGCAGPKMESTEKKEPGVMSVTVPESQPAAVEPEPPAPRYYKKFADVPTKPLPGTGWQDLLDGESLKGWEVINFGGHGEVELESGAIVLPMGDPFTGVRYTNTFPKMNYEIGLEALRVMGSDFFCGLTVPVGESCCSLILGGWGGSLVGISSLDSMDASENETTKFINFENGKWHLVRLRVTEKKIEVWLGDEKIINVATEGRKISPRPGEIERCAPLGIASWQTTGIVREVRYRTVEGPDTAPKRQDY